MDDIRGIEALIYIVAVLGGLLLPVFKQIRDKRKEAAEALNPSGGGEQPVAAQEAPMFEDREASSIPEPTIGVKPQRRQVGDFVDKSRPDLADHHLPQELATAAATPPPELARPPAPPPVKSLSGFQSFKGSRLRRGHVKVARRKDTPTRRTVDLLSARGGVRHAFVLKELVDRPISMRSDNEGRPPGWF